MKEQVGFKEINNWKILGPNGFEKFDGIKCSKADSYMEITFDNGAVLKATVDHKLFTPNDEIIELQDLKIGDECKTNNPDLNMVVSEMSTIAEDVLVYTPINVDNGFQYVTHDGLVNKNCAFVPPNIMEELWASVYPVVSSAKGTKVILVSTPNGANGLFYEIYDKAEKRVQDIASGMAIDTKKEGEEEWMPFKFLWNEVPGRDEDWKQTQIESFNGDLTKWAQEFGCAKIDSLVDIMDSTGKKEEITIGELLLRMENFSDKSSGIFLKNEDGFKVKTDSGYCKFGGVFRTEPRRVYKVYFKSGELLEVSGNHGFFDKDMKPIATKNLKTTDLVKTQYGLTNPVMIIPTEEFEELYDLTDIENDSNSYYINGILSHNCEFLGSSHILVSAERVAELESKCNYLVKMNTVRKVDYHGATMNIMHEPQEGHCYAIGCDLSDGIGGDSIVIKVIDITNPRDIKECAYLRENVMNVLHVPYILAVTGLDYNIAPILVESNHENTIIKLLDQVYEYENIVCTKNGRLGVYSTATIKVEACINLKTFLESPFVKFDTFDPTFVKELKSFEKRKSGNKYGYTYGPKNKPDDTVLGMVWTFYIFNSEILDFYFDVEYEKHGYLDIPVKCTNFHTAYEVNSAKDYFKTVVMSSHDILMKNGGVNDDPFNMDNEDDRYDITKMTVLDVGDW